MRATGGALAAQVCFSGQHGELTQRIAREVGLTPDVDLFDGDRPLGLSESLASLLERLSGVARDSKPRGVVVQGDTNTALAGALVAFHHGIPSFHVEAGLRTGDPARPFPEEMNRRLIARLASLHFAPTSRARENLLAEGVPDGSVVVTGNTIVDALEAFGKAGAESALALLSGLDPDRRSILVTLHRRENAAVVAGVAAAIRQLSRRGDTNIVWIRHPNATASAALAALGDEPGVRVLEPQPYATFVGLMRRAHAILTDSGGVQEEAPVLGVPVVVLRGETDRPEAVLSGNAIVTGGDTDAIVRACTELLDDAALHDRRSRAGNPFGDGHSAGRIATALIRYFSPSAGPPRMP
jgi:UDP-N-acetylglucosamine 2-epimerase (non-hydrolysing)